MSDEEFLDLEEEVDDSLLGLVVEVVEGDEPLGDDQEELSGSLQDLVNIADGEGIDQARHPLDLDPDDPSGDGNIDDATTTPRASVPSSSGDEEEADDGDDGDDLAVVVPRKRGEFVCSSCFLIFPEHRGSDVNLCLDCA
jgi:hypothetical protein